MDNKEKEASQKIPSKTENTQYTQHTVKEVGTLDMRLFIRTAMNLRSFKK